MSLETALKRERAVVLAGLAGITMLAWVYLLHRHSPAMAGMDTLMEQSMTGLRPWDGADLGLTFILWAVMMIAMMTPAATPAVLLFVSIRRGSNVPYRIPPSAVLVAGYLCAWLGFAALATLVQWRLHAATLASALIMARPFLSGALLIAAGIFQWTPLKRACLNHCRSPQRYFLARWRAGVSGALRMGLELGIYCVGCCWLLMSLLFLVGAMNFLWMAALTAFVLLERVTPPGLWLERLAGLLLIGAGAWLAAGMPY